MPIQLAEPTAPRYVYINPVTNKVHVLMSILGGYDISTDNTCRKTAAVKDFFSTILKHLHAYKDALEVDLLVLSPDSFLREPKIDRLTQIKIYIKAITAMQYSYVEPVNALFKRKSNLHSIQLRPTQPDPESHVVNPVFSIKRKNDEGGQPLSSLYNAMVSVFKNVKIKPSDPKSKIKEQVLSQLPPPESYENDEILFKDIQDILSTQSLNILGVKIDFTSRANGSPVTKKAIDEIMLGDNLTQEDYVDNLLNACINWEGLSNHFFYNIMEENENIKAERLSILTQFF